jgi:hypothetical protein
MILCGPTGVGKSWLACALGHKACRDNRSVLYQRVPKLFADLALARGDGRYARILRGLAGVQLLILDDWGLEPLDAGARHDLYEILEERYGRRSTILTSQLPVDKWHAVIGDPTYADAIPVLTTGARASGVLIAALTPVSGRKGVNVTCKPLTSGLGREGGGAALGRRGGATSAGACCATAVLVTANASASPADVARIARRLRRISCLNRRAVIIGVCHTVVLLTRSMHEVPERHVWRVSCKSLFETGGARMGAQICAPNVKSWSHGFLVHTSG